MPHLRAMTKKDDAPHAIANRKAGFNYVLLDRFEAGLVLTGSEVKSMRAGRANLTDAYAFIKGGELWLLNCHISRYDPAANNNHEPTRTRKLLLKKSELNKLIGKMKEKGLTVIPTRLYFSARGFVKCEIALAKGKQNADKRDTIKKREVDRSLRRALKR